MKKAITELCDDALFEWYNTDPQLTSQIRIKESSNTKLRKAKGVFSEVNVWVSFRCIIMFCHFFHI